MKAIVDHDTCIGCGICESICPAVFKVNGKATVIEKPIDTKNEANAKNAAENCPVAAITLTF